MLLLYSSTIRDVREVTGKEASPSAKFLFPGVSVGAAVIGAITTSKCRKKSAKSYFNI